MGNDAPLMPEQVDEALKSLPGWEVRDGWLRRTYKTPGFSHTMLLANAIGYLAEAAYHHPDLSLGYAQVTVKLQTHKTRAITNMDLELARKIDEVVTWQPGEESALDGYPKKWIH
jgi:4a-hydroxytetrahydrobiopterin dehydratase